MNHRDQEIQSTNDNYRVNGILINGGFSVGISKGKGLNYVKIMNMISQFSMRWPLMINLSP